MSAITGEIIAFCWLAFLLYWLGSYVLFPTKRDVKKQSGKWWLFPIIGISVFIILAESNVTTSSYLSFKLWPQTPLTGIMADVICLIGLAIMFWARTVLGRNWSSGVVFKENHELITSGPYTYVRHPIYAGLILLSLGTAIYFGQLISVTSLILVFLFFWIKSGFEEKLMGKHFPEAYPSYKKRTKALVPFIF